MQEPTCALYMRTYDHGDTNVGLEYDDLKIYPVHAAPMHAFGHDICAMHYLLRAHAKQRLHPTVDIVPNVFTLDNPR